MIPEIDCHGVEGIHVLVTELPEFHLQLLGRHGHEEIAQRRNRLLAGTMWRRPLAVPSRASSREKFANLILRFRSGESVVVTTFG